MIWLENCSSLVISEDYADMPIQAVSDTRDQIISTIRKVADTQNADFRYLLNQAKLESGLNPAARASTSSAAGLFQFTSGTWMNVVMRHGDKVGLASEAESLRSKMISNAERAQILNKRQEPYLATALAAHLAADNAQHLAAAGHKSIGPTELYMAHFLGASGANTFLNGLRDKPLEPAAKALPAAAAANTSVFFNNRTPLSYLDIYNRFAQKFADAAATSAAAAPAIKEGAAAVMEQAGALEARLKEVAANVLAASAQQRQQQAASDGAASEPLAPMPLTEDALTQYLKNFSLVDHDSGMAQVGQPHERDASRAASANDDHDAMSEQGVSPLASGARLILKATAPR
jgi:hypothetical protein